MEAMSSRRKVFTQEKRKKQFSVQIALFKGISTQSLPGNVLMILSLFIVGRVTEIKKRPYITNLKYIQKWIDENDKLKMGVKTLKSKDCDLTIKSDIPESGL